MKLDRHSLATDFCIRGSQKLSGAEFLRYIKGAQKNLETKGKRVVLAIEDSFLFAVWFFASMASGKSVILLPRVDLEQYRLHYDDVINDQTELEIPQDSDFAFDLSLENEVVFFTSGSSGQPKKIAKTLSHLLTEAKALEKAFGSFTESCLFASTAVHQHIYGFLFKILWPTMARKTWISQTLEFPEQLEDLSKLKKPWALISTPAFLKRIPEEIEPLHFCQGVFCSGGILSFEAAVHAHKKIGVYPTEIFGSTESGGVAYRHRKTEQPLWTPFNGVQVSVDLDSQLVVQSPYFPEDHLKMADRAQLTPKGFTLLGRSDDIVKIEEKRVSLQEIANKVRTSVWVKEAVAAAFESDGRQQIGCLVVLSDDGKKAFDKLGSGSLKKELRSFLRPFFEAVVLPRKFRFVEELPYDERSKLTKQKVMEVLLGGHIKT